MAESDLSASRVGDQRQLFIRDRLSSAFPKLTGGKFEKLFSTEENMTKLDAFMSDTEVSCLLVHESMKMDICSPKKLQKGKYAIFVKLAKEYLDVTSMTRNVIALEISGPNVFEQLELISNEILLPVLSNPQNQQKWGEVATREITDRFHNFLSSTTILCGLVNGETRLPMPPVDLNGNASTGKNRISLLEGAIITWTKQIRNVLKQDPESQLKQGMHPTPDNEIEFWKNKASNLNSIFDQLQSSRIRRVLRALDQSKSTYCTTFARLCKEVFTARIEANDNTKYLRTLEDWFSRLSGESDFSRLQDLFKPILHVILLIWKNSRHYNSSTRLVVLIREICNSIINQACKYVSAEEIFTLIEHGEAAVAVRQLKLTLTVCGNFKSTYFDYRSTANAECPANPWKIQNNALFMRLDSFLERCHDILDLTQTIVQFGKLEKIEIGGTKGKNLTASIKQIYDDFQKAVMRFKSLNYDIMDVESKNFDDDFYQFRCNIKELERRLGAVISSAFDDCPTVTGRFKLLDSFDSLLERPIIQDELEKKYISLAQSYGLDIKTVQENFLQNRDNPPISSNQPPVSGALTWCRGLVERIRGPMEKMRQLDKTVLEREESKEVSKIFASVITNLQEYENQKIEEWGRDVEASSRSKLNMPLLVRDGDGRHIMVNFDATLVRLLREVRYFLLLDVEVPESALSVYKQVEIFRRWTGNLDVISSKNNRVLDKLMSVEKPLVRPYLDKFNKTVERGMIQLNWKSEGLDEFIEEATLSMDALDEVVQTMKSNIGRAEEMMKQWNSPLIVRKSKPVAREELERESKIAIKERYAAIREKGKEIHSVLKETNKVLKVSNVSSDWRSFVDYVNAIVVEGLSRVVVTSLDYLLTQIDPNINAIDRPPMLEIQLTLVGKNICFQPSLYEENGKGIRDIVSSMIANFLGISNLIKRLDSDGSYSRELQADPTVCMYLAMISDCMVENERRCLGLASEYTKYSELWSVDANEFMTNYNDKASIVTALGQKLPDLAMFDQSITKFERIYQDASRLSSVVDICWLRVNTASIKSQLLALSSKWTELFNKSLKNQVINRLDSLDQFIRRVSKGLDAEVPSGALGKQALMCVMADIRDVKKLTDTTLEAFVPMRETLRLLKQHNVDIADLVVGSKNVQDLLEELPIMWEVLVKKTFKRKEDIMPLQMAECDSLRLELEQYYQSVRQFRIDFKSKAPFSFVGNAEAAYAVLSRQAVDLQTKDEQAVKYNELEELFELQMSKYPELMDTRHELNLLKKLWDIKNTVLTTYENWKPLLWADVITDELEDSNRLLKKQFRLFSTEFSIVKAWQIFKDIEETIKNMETVLPLINSLHSDAMRDRHWKTLSRVCGVRMIDPTDSKFTFEDMIRLKLHEHAVDVEEIVETASKELKIEKKLTMIENDWAKLELSYIQHKESEMRVVKPSEEVIEALESHQMELQTMIGMGKFVDYFRDRVVSWQNTLGHMEDVLKVWVNVSKSWGSLESIFLESADIRSQLPEDTKRFEGIDSEFKELMKDAMGIPNVVQVTTVEGRLDVLQSIMSRLEECQKSLNEYLDQKKKIFPRFYFVSNVALLDMLANGTNPPKIIKYLADCYDSIAEVKFIKNEDGSRSNRIVDRMIAKDKEEIALYEPFTMQGEVEVYLNNLTEAMRTTLRHELSRAVESAANWEIERPRHLWLFDYAAQAVVTVSQVYWTEETELALEELETGQEDAVKRYLATSNQRLSDLIQLVLGKLADHDRVKIITLITLDVHGRDVVQRLIDEKTEGPSSFLWQQQLRFYWNQPTTDADIRICDYKTKYFYEWIGNTGRLVITPLTDRCYVTLSMGLRLFLGGAPAGPAGTGKTETTKDLARSLAIPCYVFNCSDQMNYKTMADIFKGLAQTGAWGCFDEFNRIPIEVLSVIATQVKTIQDYTKRFSIVANRELLYQNAPPGLPPVKVGEFPFEGDVVSLIPSCGLFITMNPGYAGRTELPENLKALFRSCAMIRPDLRPICENMLMSEGFQKARSLAIKFVTLYQLSSELLSKQFHYDWGLRAVKSVLRVAGMLKRADPGLDEAQILIRALRDFNTPKIPAIDTPIFLRLISDLFMGMDVAPKVNESLKQVLSSVATCTKLQCNENFILKCLQFQELLDVRHSVMLLGPTGCGKTQIWKTLAGAHNWDVEKNCFKTRKTAVYETINPKAVTGDELYGYMTLAKDWKDGVLSIIMRGMSKNISEQGFHEYQTSKWVVLDGDIDSVWIESMNTVMDDNKVLTLVSNERVPLSDSMRMVFEISSLKNATPATVSRAGILYVNESDIGWRPFVESWIQKREEKRKDDPSTYPDPNGMERACLPGLFDKYIDALTEMTRKGYKEMTPIRTINKVSTVMFLMEALLESCLGENKTSDVLESLFIYSCIWAFGGAMVQDKLIDYRKQFSEQFSSMFGQKFPKEGQCFDYFYDLETETFKDWNSRIQEYVPLVIGSGSSETLFSALHVSTQDTVRISFLIDLLARRGHHAMLVGGAGTGKTAILNQYLQSLDSDVDGYLSTVMNMTYYTDSRRLQQEMELTIEKRSGRRYGPPVNKKLIYFVDDINLPFVETYGTQNSIALLTQYLQYGAIFDRSDLSLRKEIVDTQVLAAMNSTAGSFDICERCQRHFATFSCVVPSQQDLKTIFGSIFGGHLQSFSQSAIDCSSKIVDASVQLHDVVSKKFLPSAVKFTYNWNMRELVNLFQGLCLASSTHHDSPTKLYRLWTHEASRVFADRLLSADELSSVNDLIRESAKKNFNGINIDDLFSQSFVFTKFVGSSDNSYVECPSSDKLRSTLENKLTEHNESNSIMDLVLFRQAAEHVSRICRIISNPNGHAMLIGVGGSGKQSLSRLAAFICGFEIRQLAVTSNYKVDDLKEALKEMIRVTGVKGLPLLWLMTDSQIVDDKFLVYICGILARGWVPDLFARDEMDSLFTPIRTEAKSIGIADTMFAMTEFLVNRVRSNFHLSLCFSPVGDSFKVRSRRFPGLVNCSVIDYFHPWPREALISVAGRFLDEVDLGGASINEGIAIHMAEQHLSVTDASVDYLKSQRRYNYVTPKSFLELIFFYKHLLGMKRNENMRQIDRLDIGLSTLRKTASDVTELQNDLKHTLAMVEEKKQSTDDLLTEMGVQRADAEKQQQAANVEAEKANIAAREAGQIESQAEIELRTAKPAMEAAAAAVDCLSKAMLTELKALPKPPAGVDDVTACCLILIEKEYKNHKWERAKKMMANIDQFKQKLMDFRGEDIPEDDITRLEPFMNKEDFKPEIMLNKSVAAANLCTWVVNIYSYNRIYVRVKPLMDSLEEARRAKEEANASLQQAMDAVAVVEGKLQVLQQRFVDATEEKARVEAQAANCLARLGLAERLVGGLSSENQRWGAEIDKLREHSTTLVGDCMLAAGFVSYIGAFDQEYRVNLWKNIWTADLVHRAIPLTASLDPLSLLTNDGNNAKMISDGLPSDRTSIENGAITSNCKRWPLIIDPQQQGIKWLKTREDGNNLTIITFNTKKWTRLVQNAISNGTTVIIENVGEDLDTTLEPVLSRSVYRKGRNLYIKFAGEEIEYDEKFKLFLQSKLSNPHYKPEIAAQCTIVNFIATELGLEDQLLAKIVGVERPELEKRAQDLQASFQKYKIQLVALEDDLLERLANAPDDILSDVPLIEGLEATKTAAKAINDAVILGKKTEQEINNAREIYRPVANEGAILYFLLTKLCVIDHMYQYSLDSFTTFFFKAAERAEVNENEHQRVSNLKESLRLTIYTWVSRGLFERHKIILLSQITFMLLQRGILGEENKINSEHFNFLMRCPRKEGEPNPLKWLPDSAWHSCCALSCLEVFHKFTSDLVEASSRFQEWYNQISPETEKLPLDWAGLDRTPFEKMMVVRCLRPDRMTTFLPNFIKNVLPKGIMFSDCDSSLGSVDIIDQTLSDSTAKTPIYFILSPGSNVVGDLDKLAQKYGFVAGDTYHNISMGQGQDVVAMRNLELGHRNGHWIILNNIHLMPRWLIELEKKLDEFSAEGSHSKFRLFLSSEPSTNIPIGVLNRSIKLTNEPPAGLTANLKRAFTSLNKEQFEDYDSKTKNILFGLCYFHAVMIERKQFGPMGFNMMYPFSMGDLRDSTIVLQNYMENSGGGKIPWQDLKYIFGEIMYGGHIVNDFDRLLANTYLDFFMKDELLDETEMYPFVEDEKGVSFKTTVPTAYERYLDHIDENMRAETPLAFGLHPNAEIDFRTTKSVITFRTLLDLQPRESKSGEGQQSPIQVAEVLASDILDRFGEKKYDIEDLSRSLDEQGPFQNVFLQEMDVMNDILGEMLRSLKELQQGFAGELTMSDSMENLMTSLFMDVVPNSWAKRAWPSTRSLGGWLNNLNLRLAQLDDWGNNPSEIPRVTWLSGLINPQSFLTAICQVTAQKNQLELDKLTTFTDVKKYMTIDEVDIHSKDGAYISGLQMQGARWDAAGSSVEKSKPKEMYCSMPIINVRSVPLDKAEPSGTFMCPVYKTDKRGSTFVFCAQLKTRSPPARWILAGVAMILDTSG